MPNEVLQSIVGSLISGIFSIVVALIGKARTSSERSGKTSGPVYQIPPHHSRAWRFLLCALIIWFLLSPFALGWKIAGINLLATIPITVIAAFVRPVRPATATATVLVLYCVHFLMAAFWLSTAASSRDVPLNVGITLGLLVVNLVVCWVVSRSASRRFRVNPVPASTHRATPPGVASSRGSDSLADEIAKLNELRQSGVLTESEFQTAKKRLLDS